MANKARVYAIGAGLLTSITASILAYVVFDWALIQYWEWHLGHRLMITLGIDVLV
jgi:hypothetical protein